MSSRRMVWALEKKRDKDCIKMPRQRKKIDDKVCSGRGWKTGALSLT